MNKEYNDNREYKNALDELHFSEEAKNRMVDRLLESAEQPEKPAVHRVRRFPRIAAVGVAAALVLSIGAGASGVLKSASEVFAGVFGPTADTKIIDQIGRPIGASDTVNGVTVTADAILFDGYNYLISYTLEKEDGSSFGVKTNPDTNLLDLLWEDSTTDVGVRSGGFIGSSWFYDENPDDNAIQYVATMSYDDVVKSGRTTKITLKNLCDFSEDNPSPISLVDGTWHLKFKLNAENCSKELPAGQKLSINGKAAPIGYNLAYTVDDEVQFEDAESGRAPASHRDTWKEFTGEQFITLKDGTTIDLASGGSMDPEDGKTYCVRQGTFERILPLEDMASLTIGGVSIPIE